MYERSYMHRDNVTHTAVSRKDFIITASKDGHVKFWKKKPEGVEFVKHFRAHVGRTLAGTVPRVSRFLLIVIMRWVCTQDQSQVWQ